MTITLDLSDVPPVAVDDLKQAMTFLVQAGNGRCLIKGLRPEAKRDLEQDLWQRFDGDAQRRLATLVRLENLIAVFASRRLQQLLLLRGFALISPALAIAATMRLNASWGFNPQRVLTALQGTPAIHRPVHLPEPVLQLAA